MLMRVACVRCRLASLWTDEPRSFLSTICRDPRRCEATLLDEEFQRISAAPVEPTKPAGASLDGSPAA
jgi:hypothetical protein